MANLGAAGEILYGATIWSDKAKLSKMGPGDS